MIYAFVDKAIALFIYFFNNQCSTVDFLAKKQEKWMGNNTSGTKVTEKVDRRCCTLLFGAAEIELHLINTVSIDNRYQYYSLYIYSIMKNTDTK